MDLLDLKVTYLYHSGFMIEGKNVTLIFDYYQPLLNISLPKNSSRFTTGDFLKEKPHVYVFASHNHYDHFDSKIFNWIKFNQEITYLLSDDIRPEPKTGSFLKLGAYQTYKDGLISVETFGSTDQGVSFLVQIDEVSIFHAGDLNWWHWKEDTVADQQTAERAFKDEIAKIKTRSIDVAFFPVDPRLEEFYADGAEYFAAVIKPKLLIPMHFGDNFKTTRDFLIKNPSIPSVEITHRGQEINFSF